MVKPGEANSSGKDAAELSKEKASEVAKVKATEDTPEVIAPTQESSLTRLMFRLGEFFSRG